jgi:FKBP-type peptidyl-prolyl cis-trans isomerase FklB
MDKKSYALGMSIANNLRSSGVTSLDATSFAEGVADTLSGGKTRLTIEEAGDILEKLFKELEDEKAADQAAVAAAFKEEGEKWLKDNAKEPGVKVTASGLQYKVIKEGTGRKPGPTDTIRCHYEGTFTTGDVFDSSYKRGEPIEFALNQVIRGWTEGLQLMSEGSTYELYIPYQLAYGERGAGGSIPPCAALKFKVELIKVL